MDADRELLYKMMEKLLTMKGKTLAILVERQDGELPPQDEMREVEAKPTPRPGSYLHEVWQVLTESSEPMTVTEVWGVLCMQSSPRIRDFEHLQQTIHTAAGTKRFIQRVSPGKFAPVP